MHKYMRAIGFSEYTDRKKLKELLTDVIMNSDHRAYTMNQEGILLGEFSKNHTTLRVPQNPVPLVWLSVENLMITISLSMNIIIRI